jgi:methionyl aminopeptidase
MSSSAAKFRLIKSKEEIEIIREGGQLMHKILRDIGSRAVPGVSTWELDRYAEEQILKVGGKPAFKGVGGPENPYPATLCTSINDEVVHGIPSKHVILEDGDIIGLDIGMQYKGLFTDTAITVAVGKISPIVQKLLDVTEKSLKAAIAVAKVGNTIGDIGFATQQVIENAGFNVVRDLVGHGVGYEVHEDPMVPGYGKKGKGEPLLEGMVLAIEPMVVTGSYRLFMDDDLWTIRTADGGLSAHFEHTVAITAKGASILT